MRRETVSVETLWQNNTFGIECQRADSPEQRRIHKPTANCRTHNFILIQEAAKSELRSPRRLSYAAAWRHASMLLQNLWFICILQSEKSWGRTRSASWWGLDIRHARLAYHDLSEKDMLRVHLVHHGKKRPGKCRLWCCLPTYIVHPNTTVSHIFRHMQCNDASHLTIWAVSSCPMTNHLAHAVAKEAAAVWPRSCEQDCYI